MMKLSIQEQRLYVVLREALDSMVMQTFAQDSDSQCRILAAILSSRGVSCSESANAPGPRAERGDYWANLDRLALVQRQTDS